MPIDKFVSPTTTEEEVIKICHHPDLGFYYLTNCTLHDDFSTEGEAIAHARINNPKALIKPE